MSRKFEVRDRVDKALAIEHYSELAQNYDATCSLIEPFRRKAIALLNLQLGDVVLDIASGTGKSFALLSEAVGAKGLVIGIEQSPEMAALSRQRAAVLDLNNVVHLLSSVEDAAIPSKIDAVLFHYTHDVLRTPEALGHVFKELAQKCTRLASCV
jgi:ubiquinone/menaquinone biosynthesis C-methylase UbiE